MTGKPNVSDVVLFLRTKLPGIATWFGALLLVVTMGCGPKAKIDPKKPPEQKVILPDDVQDALDSLPDVEVVSLGPEGLPNFIRGNLGSAVAGVDSSTMDKLGPYADRIASVFRLQAVNLRKKKEHTDGFGDRHLRYQQYRNGLRVVGGTLSLHVKNDGTIYAANGTTRAGMNLSCEPTLDAEFVLSELQSAAPNGSFTFGEPELVYLVPQNRSVHLTWEILVEGRSHRTVKELVYLDAHTGETITRHSQIRFALQREIYEFNVAGNLNLLRQEKDNPHADAAVNAAYDHAHTAYHCFHALFGRDSYDASGASIRLIVNYEEDPLTAFANTVYWVMVFGMGNVTDEDGDGTADYADNCPLASNPGQADTDGDGVGDGCQNDQDGDTVVDAADNCPRIFNPGQGPCQDSDADGVADATDLCPNTVNPDQQDFDGDGIADDACKVASDDDGDGVPNINDNCPFVSNAGGGDWDGDGIGDACDWCPLVANSDQRYVPGCFLMDNQAKDPDVVLHEFTHLVNHSTADFAYLDESGAIDEAMATVFAVVCDAWSRGELNNDAAAQNAAFWMFAEETLTPDTPGDAVLHLDDPQRTPGYTDFYPDRYTRDPLDPPGDDNNRGGVHLNLTIATLAFKLLVTGGQHPRGRTPLVTVDGIGLEKAARIFYRALTVYLQSFSNFTSTRTATIQAAIDLYGPDVADEVKKAWEAVGVLSTFQPVMPLENGVVVTDLSDGLLGDRHFTFEVPAGATDLTFTMSGGSGNADLYVRFGTRPDTASSDFSNLDPGNEVAWTAPSATEGTWFVMIRASQPYSGVTLTASYQLEPDQVLENGVPVTGLEDTSDSTRYFTLEVPAGAENLTFQIFGGAGDADLYVKHGARPTTSVWDYRGYSSGNNETLAVSPAQEGIYHVMVNGHANYTGVTLLASYTVPVVPLCDCSGRNCGDDGCGGSCGTCVLPDICDESTGQCICQPECAGKECGDDGCAGSCGTCESGQICTASDQCCAPNCWNKQCGSDGCGSTCGICSFGKTCNVFGQCCTPNCLNKQCGNDGCGGSCGSCWAGQTCNSFGQCVTCTPSCWNKQCGSDGCGDSCGTCLFGQTCNFWGQCV